MSSWVGNEIGPSEALGQPSTVSSIEQADSIAGPDTEGRVRFGAPSSSSECALRLFG